MRLRKQKPCRDYREHEVRIAAAGQPHFLIRILRASHLGDKFVAQNSAALVNVLKKSFEHSFLSP